MIYNLCNLCHCNSNIRARIHNWYTIQMFDLLNNLLSISDKMFYCMISTLIQIYFDIFHKEYSLSHLLFSFIRYFHRCSLNSFSRQSIISISYLIFKYFTNNLHIIHSLLWYIQFNKLYLQFIFCYNSFDKLNIRLLNVL
jgi:hypothetical protein